MISLLSGSTELLNLATASPSLFMRNFSKFHSTSPAGFTLFYVVNGSVVLPFACTFWKS